MRLTFSGVVVKHPGVIFLFPPLPLLLHLTVHLHLFRGIYIQCTLVVPSIKVFGELLISFAPTILACLVPSTLSCSVLSWYKVHVKGHLRGLTSLTPAAAIYSSEMINLDAN